MRPAIAGGLGELGDAEVEKLHVSVRIDEDVVGLDVTMDDSPGVCSRQPVRHLRRPLERDVQRHPPPREAMAERLAVQEFGDEVGESVVKADVVDGHQIGVVERAGEPGFLLKRRTSSASPARD